MRRLPRYGVVAALIVAGIGTAGCEHHTITSTTAVTDDGDHEVVASRGDIDSASFEIASGVTTFILQSGDIGDRLYDIKTPVGAGVIPTAVVSGNTVVAQLSSSGVNGPSIVAVVLNSGVAWTIHLDGGATEATVNMKDGGLAALDFGAGVTRIDTTLPATKGNLGVRMAGGASEFTVHAPFGVPTRVTMGGGGGSATIDGTTHSGIAGGTVYDPAGWDGAQQRIDIDTTAGVSTFTLDRY